MIVRNFRNWSILATDNFLVFSSYETIIALVDKVNMIIYKLDNFKMTDLKGEEKIVKSSRTTTKQFNLFCNSYGINLSAYMIKIVSYDFFINIDLKI